MHELTPDATREIGHYRRKWGQKVRPFASVLFNNKSGPVNEHALSMRQDAEAAMSLAESGLVRFGWYSATIVLRNRDPHELEEMTRTAVRAINDCGFAARIETTKTVEAWRGALPGDMDCQIRRPPIHTQNLADLLPLSGVWTGQSSAPCPYYPQPSPPLMHAATVGGIPFRLNLHVGDVGHTLNHRAYPQQPYFELRIRPALVARGVGSCSGETGFDRPITRQFTPGGQAPHKSLCSPAWPLAVEWTCRHPKHSSHFTCGPR